MFKLNTMQIPIRFIILKFERPTQNILFFYSMTQNGQTPTNKPKENLIMQLIIIYYYLQKEFHVRLYSN